MKVQKYEISRTIDKLKSIVQKNDQFPGIRRRSGKGRVFNRIQYRNDHAAQIRGL